MTRNTRQGQMGAARLAIGMVLIVIVTLTILLPTLNQSYSTETNAVTDEQHAVSGSLPQTLQADNVGNGLVEDSVTVEYWNSTGDGTNTTIDSNNLSINYLSGEVTVENASVTVDSADTWLLTYDWKPENYVEPGPTRLILDQLDLAAVLIILIGTFGALVRML